MFDGDIYKTREKIVPKSNRSMRKYEKRRETPDDQIRKRRSNNRGFHRIFHLAKRESVRKYLMISMSVAIFLFLIFTWFYSY